MTTNAVTTTSLLPGGDPFATRAAASSSDQSVATKDMFLKLLVAQIKNQDPLNPADGVQYVAQLAQFTQLEQSLSMSSDLHSIRTTLEKSTQSADGSGNAAGTAH
jgi:flagellar basal-body rod modification protein FlgD